MYSVLSEFRMDHVNVPKKKYNERRQVQGVNERETSNKPEKKKMKVKTAHQRSSTEIRSSFEMLKTNLVHLDLFSFLLFFVFLKFFGTIVFGDSETTSSSVWRSTFQKNSRTQFHHNHG